MRNADFSADNQIARMGVDFTRGNQETKWERRAGDSDALPELGDAGEFSRHQVVRLQELTRKVPHRGQSGLD